MSSDVLLSFLEQPSSFPHQPESVDVVQTHISYVAIAPPYVYKVKKPVDFGFLDFTSVEKRKHFCEEELRLNRRLCSDIYEAVVPITSTSAGLAFDGDGPIVDYAVRMKKLAAGYFMDQLIRSNSLTRHHIDHTTDKLLEFYAATKSSPRIANCGRIEKLRINTDENFDQTQEFVDDLIAQPSYNALRYYTDRFYHCHAGLLERRRAEGRILDCHGDLHAEHIHIMDGSVCIYDCIEFNERFRFNDVASDLAFLAMDLDYNGEPTLSRYFIRKMAVHLDDPELEIVVDFYKSYRAYVRAKVDSLRSSEEEVPADERKASRQRAGQYYRRSLQYALAGSRPLVIAVTGRVGTGKSTLAGSISDALGWKVYSTDRLRKQSAGVPLDYRGDASERAQLYSESQTNAVYKNLQEISLDRARQWKGTVLDATFSSRKHRDELRSELTAAGIPYFFVEAVAPDQLITSRLEARSQSEGVVSDARLEDFDMLSSRYETPDALEDARHFSVSTDADADDCLEEILKGIIDRADG